MKKRTYIFKTILRISLVLLFIPLLNNSMLSSQTNDFNEILINQYNCQYNVLYCKIDLNLTIENINFTRGSYNTSVGQMNIPNFDALKSDEVNIAYKEFIKNDDVTKRWQYKAKNILYYFIPLYLLFSIIRLIVLFMRADKHKQIPKNNNVSPIEKAV